MPRGPGSPIRPRKEPIADSYVMASVDQADGKCDPKTGFYAWCILRMDPGDDIAEWHRALRRAAVYLHSHQVADVGIHVEKGTDARGKYLRYVAINKAHTYQYMLSHYGTDRTKWPYNVHARGES
jgi:hypothetical protein